MKTLLSVAILTAISSSTLAIPIPIGTAAGTEVNNTASISYKVGGATQTPIESSETGNTTPGAGKGTATTFVVDKKIDLLVTGSTTTNVVPGQTGAANNTELTYTLLNEGNSTESFTLTASDNLALVPGADDFNSTNCTVTAPATLPVSLASGAQVSVTVECDIPSSSATVINGSKSLVDLLAEVTGVTETTAADSAGCTTGTIAGGNCVVDVVFADSTGTGTDGNHRNAKHSSTSTYIISTANLTVKKTEAVTAMEINNANVTGNKYHIPGSTIVYTITVVNANGAATATEIVLTDTVPATMTVVGTPTIAITSGNGGSATMASGAGISAVATNAFDLDADETATLTITATVN